MVEKTEQNSSSNAANRPDGESVFMLVFEIILVHIRFWYLCLEAVMKTFLPVPPTSVENAVVLITGTGHGMGKEMALQYAQLGAKVICWDINEKNNLETVKEIKAAGGKAFAYTCNVMQRNEIYELSERVKKEHGFVSIVVNNAGIMPCHPLLEHTETEIRNMYEINVISHYWIIQAFLPDMIERNEGHFVALSSCAGLFGLPNLVPYCGTKFAVRGYMAALAEELRRKNPRNNVKFTTIFPYMIDTGLCKKPRYRFPKFQKLVSAKDAAESIIRAQRSGLEEASIPRAYLHIEKFGRLFPKNAMRVLNDFIDAGVDSDK